MEALQKLNSNCIFPRVVAKDISVLLWDIPVSLLDDHHVWVDILQAQPASGTDLAGRMHFGFGASGSMVIEVQLQHFCKKIFISEAKSALQHKPKMDRLSPPNFKITQFT